MAGPALCGRQRDRTRGRVPEPGSPSPARGDHDLNPGMGPECPLTPAAVLIPVIDRAGGLTVLLTKRTGHLASHAGQISFRGGRVESGDGSLENAALRETEAEIGLSRDRVRILGRVDDYITRTGFRVAPVVAVVELRFEPSPEGAEVRLTTLPPRICLIGKGKSVTIAIPPLRRSLTSVTRSNVKDYSLRLGGEWL